MKKTIVTVLMSVYNGEKYLHTAVDSILKQTFNDFEFIIINDGSIDKTRVILEAYQDERIVLIHQENKGLTSALNKGLSLAKGEYIARMDADDSCMPERLEKQVACLKENPEVVLLGTNCFNVSGDGTLIGQVDLPIDEVEIKWNLLFYNCLRHSTVMFRKKEVKKLGGYKSTICYAQDYDLWLRISERYPIACLKDPLIYYRIPREGTITYEKESEQAKQAEQTYLEVIYKLIPEITFRDDEIKELRYFISDNGELRNVDNAEKLFLRIFSAFCNSSFTAHINKDKLKNIMYASSVRFAWCYFNKGDLDNFDRCVNKLMDSGFPGPFDPPANDLYKEEKSIFKALNNYYLANKKDVKSDAGEKNFLCSQYANFAWKYYAMGEMRQFRRCLLKSFRNHPSAKGAVLLLKSLLGRRTIEGIHRLRVMFKERSQMGRIAKNDEHVVY